MWGYRPQDNRLFQTGSQNQGCEIQQRTIRVPILKEPAEMDIYAGRLAGVTDITMWACTRLVHQHGSPHPQQLSREHTFHCTRRWCGPVATVLLVLPHTVPPNCHPDRAVEWPAKAAAAGPGYHPSGCPESVFCMVPCPQEEVYIGL